ncbi:MAG: F0F1 ATP synthase subunit epsilon [Alphaproteobacteria bacterium]|nr:F0F1 ATP synthase subunit epsilon [Alphaproteobacteria bacterium]
MRLTIATPLSLVVEADDVEHVRAEDETGAFGILKNHADFLTVLTTSVVTWRDTKGAEHYTAVRGGTLRVSGGTDISIATREAVLGTDLRRLQEDVLVKFRQEAEEEKAAGADAERLYLAALRQISNIVRGERGHGMPPRLEPDQLDGAAS